MKTNSLKIAAFFAAASIFLLSCDKDKIEINDPDGEPTMMTVGVTFPNSATKASNQYESGTEAESKIHYVDIFIYSATTGNFLSYNRLDASKFNYKGDNGSANMYTATAKIPTTTGKRIVFAGINLPQELAKGLDGKHLSALAGSVQEMSKAELIGDSEDKFAMFSVEGEEADFKYDEALNNISLRCQRLVAKIVVEKDPLMKLDGVAGVFLGDELTYGINNFNRKMFLLQGDAPFKDPNWAAGSYNNGADFNVLADFKDYAEVKGFDKNVLSSTPLYASENTSEAKTKRELTRATVRAQFIPEKIADWDDDKKTLKHVSNTNYPTVAKTFYAVVASIYDGTYYFLDEDMAKEFAEYKTDDLKLTIPIEPIKYTDGWCYWDIFLNRNPLTPANQWDVLRNDFYRCKITRITTPGRSGPDIDAPGGGGTGPDEKPDTDTNISVDIEVLHWQYRGVEEYELY